ncbi:MAG: CRISPR system precrRNA processing endoribonuclease RAMP protein Cas6 [Syntrophales bacterium]|nr:CRISPR system precrRNA processing endoribonuclease RAMP protein Cas6 [Syntrophales bacterium]
MLYGSYLFKCRFIDEAHFRTWPGYEFIRIFIPALKKVVCATREKNCKICSINRRCLFPQFVQENRSKKRFNEDPLPFVLEPPETPNGIISKESLFFIKLILFGKANESFTHFAKVVEEMGYIGAGKNPNGDKARFVVVDVQYESCASDVLLKGKNIEGDIWIDLKKEFLRSFQQVRETSFNRVAVKFRTPLFTNEIKRELPFEKLIAVVFKRLGSLFRTFGTGEIPLDLSNLRAAARRAFTISSDLHFAHQPLGTGKERGIVGVITYGHVPALFIPLLECGTKTHIGNYTHIGMGKMELLGRD